ncbi:hypothetical protein ACLMJK_004931 [Lecanora helva]
MTEAPLAVASAVILPDETSEPPAASPPSLKRRQSSISDGQSKRPRLSRGESSNHLESAASPATPTAPLDRASERRKSGQVEERKRGQRLFGALLGTLSQSSSSTAQKRRTDIERKQQAKLKQQEEEQDEKKKQKREALHVIRRREQVKYDKQSMQIRHSNMLAQAHFLHTKAEPRIYYKPYEFLPGDEEKIKAQIEEAEQIIEKESAQWDADHADADHEPSPKEPEKEKEQHPETKEETPEDQKNTVGTDSADRDQLPPPSNPPAISEDTNMEDTNGDNINGEQEKHDTTPNQVAEASTEQMDEKDHGDDGGEEVIGEEDTVIY